MTDTKDARWTIRVGEPADSAVRAAASATQRNLTDFVVGAAISEADRVLSSRTRFVLDEAQWERFVALLDRPTDPPEGLTKLFSATSAFE